MLNFGKWESEEAKDPNEIECHGHLHFQLTQNVALNELLLLKNIHIEPAHDLQQEGSTVIEIGYNERKSK